MTTQAEVAAHLDLGLSRFRALVREGTLPGGERGKWDVDRARVAYIRHLRERSTGRPSAGGKARAEGDSRLHELKVRTEESKAARSELEVERMRGRLVELAGVMQLIEAIGHECRTALLASADAVAPQLVGLDDEAEIARILEDEHRDALAGLATASGRILSRLGAAPAPDDLGVG